MDQLEKPTCDKLSKQQGSRLKKLNFIYPTADIQQRNYPKLYPDRLPCMECTSTVDTNEHLGLCPAHKESWTHFFDFAQSKNATFYAKLHIATYTRRDGFFLIIQPTLDGHLRILANLKKLENFGVEKLMKKFIRQTHKYMKQKYKMLHIKEELK
ncbi:hypothetical protein RhiirC2_713410 [Rhizophagus irregularis]|uniref:Uncharacterized protein n=1 Tax=Rhizophagus irregularis TaxID=588596 RepID=A0A2N1N3G4_9GLOM|nr:hypothetical protein RhiirC2_713410 [Rhizophagus irregularis]